MSQFWKKVSDSLFRLVSPLPAATTMDLLSNMETSSEVLRQNAVAPSNVQSTDFLHQFGSFGPLNSMDIAEGDFRCVALRAFSVL